MTKKQQLKYLGILLVISIIFSLPIISAGNQQIAVSKTFGGGHYDTAFSLAWDFGNPRGNLYVVGTSSSFSTYLEGIVVKFGENLEEPATAVKMSGFTGNGEFFDVAVPIGVTSNNIAVVGYVPHNNRDPAVYWLSKTDLSTVAAKRLQVFTGTQHDRATAVAYDSLGNTIVAGFTDSGTVSPFTGRVSFLVKFSDPDTIAWQVAFEPLNAEGSFPSALAIDGNNNIIVAGSFNLPGRVWDAYVAKFNSTNGNLIWMRTLADGRNDNAYGVAVDNVGNIYVAGTTNSFKAATDRDIFVAKFDPAGNLLWFRTINLGAGDDIAYSIAVIQYDHVYITGVTYSMGSGDTFFAKLSANGDVLYVMVSGMDGEDIGYKVALNIHSKRDIFYVNIAGRSVVTPPDNYNFANFTTYTVSSPSVTVGSPSVSTTDPDIDLTDLPSLQPVEVRIPDNALQRGIVYKFDPPTAVNETKNNINSYLSYWLIPIIIVSISLIAVLIKRKK
jgi:hypothetical protein